MPILSQRTETTRFERDPRSWSEREFPGFEPALCVLAGMAILSEVLGELQRSQRGDNVMSKGNTVLVIEDEEHIRMVVEYNLRLDGFEVYLAEDGPAGLRLARQIRPEVILLDWMMPEMDGLEVLAELKHDKETEHIPVVMLTARGMDGDMERAFEMGVNDYITKPFNPRLLGETIRKRLQEQVGAESSHKK